MIVLNKQRPSKYLIESLLLYNYLLLAGADERISTVFNLLNHKSIAFFIQQKANSETYDRCTI